MENKKIQETKDWIQYKLNHAFGEDGDKLFIFLVDKGFLENRASTKYHGNYKGGLLDHCENFYNKLWDFKNSKIILPYDDRFVIAYLHDICKVGVYNADGTYNKEHPKGHANLSLEIIERFVTLTEFQREAIKYHMGVYSTYEFAGDRGEYSLKELTDAWNKDPRIKFVHWCDDFVSQFVDFKK